MSAPLCATSARRTTSHWDARKLTMFTTKIPPIWKSAVTSKIFLALPAMVAWSILPGCQSEKAAGPPPPAEVEVVSVVQKDVPIYGEWVATLDGYVNAQIQPQVTGYLIKQDYREGSLVHRGDVLFEIDPRPFQALLDQAKAQLAQAEAQFVNATLNVKRDVPEAEANAIARSQLEGDTQMQLVAKATVAAGHATVEQAALNLS